MNLNNILSKISENNWVTTAQTFEELKTTRDISPPSDRVDEYMQVLHDLSYEKDNITLHDYEKKTERTYLRALAIITINGDDKFKENTLNRIKNICQLKPGRKLFKALSSYKDSKITIGKGKEFTYSRPGVSSSGFINIVRLDNFIETTYDINETFYNTYNKCFSSKPDFVGLAHELIHFVHYLEGGCLFTKCLKNMDELEEQHTILGYNHVLFAKKAPLTEIDVLCETAFLLALNKPPRIDHQGYNSKYTLCETFEFAKDSIIFSRWLKKKLSKLYPEIVSIEQLHDSRFMYDLIQLKPEYIVHAEKAIKSGIFRSLKDFPAGLENLDFAKSFISFHFLEENLDKDFLRKFNSFTSSILSKKEFVIFLYDQILSFKESFTNELTNPSFLNFLEKCEAFDKETKKYQQTAINLSIISEICTIMTKKLNPELNSDPEIQEKIDLITSRYRFDLLRPSENYQNAHWPNGVRGW